MQNIKDQSITQYPPRVIQFGEGNFMRGFFNWQLAQMNKQGLFQRSAIVVQPIPQGLKALLDEQDDRYTVILEGLVDGVPMQKAEIISTIHEVIDPYQQWQEFLALADNEALDIIVSNTTEAGIRFDPSDTISDTPPSSYPAKLTALLYRRFQSKKSGFTIIPCELIDRNGEKLKQAVQSYAELWALPKAFSEWLDSDNQFCCSLVDRIVPGYPREQAAAYETLLGYQDQLIVTAEPFMLWVIEGSEIEAKLPLAAAGLNVIVTDDMTPYRERKVHLLNGPHTAIVSLGCLAGLETVEDVMNDPDFALYVDRLFQNELIPMLDLPETQLRAYAEEIKERFKNPYVHHQLQSIALNSVSKFTARLLPVLMRFYQKKQQIPLRITASLAALLHLYLTGLFEDDALVTAIFTEAKQLAPSAQYAFLLGNEALWQMDLRFLTDDIQTMTSILALDGPRALLHYVEQQEAVSPV